MLLFKTNEALLSLSQTVGEADTLLELPNSVANSTQRSNLVAALRTQRVRLKTAERLNAVVGLILGIAVSSGLLVIAFNMGRGNSFSIDLASDILIMMCMLSIFRIIIRNTWAGAMAMYSGTMMLCGSILWRSFSGSFRIAYLIEWILLIMISSVFLTPIKEHRLKYRVTLRAADYAAHFLDD